MGISKPRTISVLAQDRTQTIDFITATIADHISNWLCTLVMSMVCDALTFAPKLFHDLTSTMVGRIFNWLGTLFMPMIYDALSLRWVLPTYWTSIAYLSTNYSFVCLVVLFSGPQCRFNLLEPKDTRLQAFSLLMAERLQHVEAPIGETCVVCHDPEPHWPSAPLLSAPVLLRLRTSDVRST